MGGSGVGGEIHGFRFRRLSKPEEFRQVLEVHRSIWGAESVENVPATVLRAVQDNGGLVLGAFADIHLAGYTAASLGWDGTKLYLYDHELAVRPEYQNHRIGTHLMRALRDEVLGIGLDEIRLVFDPLQSRNAELFVRRLGGRPDRYLHHYFGQLPDPVNQGLETDRMRLVWPLSDARSVQRAAGHLPTREAEIQRWTKSLPIISTEAGESGTRLPREVAEPDGPEANLEIPFDLDLVRQHEPAALRSWRHATRDAFRIAADLGFVIDDFAVVPAAHERRAVYFLVRSAPAEPPTPSGPPS